MCLSLNIKRFRFFILFCIYSEFEQKNSFEDKIKEFFLLFKTDHLVLLKMQLV